MEINIFAFLRTEVLNLGKFLDSISPQCVFSTPILFPPGEAGKPGQGTVKFHFIFLEIKCVFFVLSGTASVLVILNNPSFTETLSSIENGCQEFKTITSRKGLYVSEKLLKLFQITQFHIVEM